MNNPENKDTSMPTEIKFLILTAICGFVFGFLIMFVITIGGG